MGVDDDAAVGGLPENFGQAHHRHDFAFNQVPQHHARPNGRQLVNVADQQQAGLGRQGAEQVGHERDIHHGGFIHDQEITVERIAFVPPKAAGGRLHFQQAVDGLGLDAGGFGQAFGGPAGGRAKQTIHFLGPQNQQDGIDQGRLADARAAGDDERPAGQRQFERVALAGCKLLAGLLLAPDHRLLKINGGERGLKAGQALDPAGDDFLGPFQVRQENQFLPADAFP